MYIRDKKNKKRLHDGRRGEFVFSPKQNFKKIKEVEPVKKIERIERIKRVEKNEPKKIEAPHYMLIGEHSRDVKMHWRAPEFEIFERDKKWYILILTLLIGIVTYAIFVNSLIMSITFILIGVVGYMYINKEPRTLDFIITKDGIVAGREIYPFDNLKSFWIFYEPHDIRVISLHTESYLSPYVHIPIPDEDPVKIREVLLGNIPEEKHEPGIIELLDRILRL